MPSYKEASLDLISILLTDYTSKELVLQYQYTHSDKKFLSSMQYIIVSTLETKHKSMLSISTISLGTMKISRRKRTEIVANMLKAGFKSTNIAPIYNNEDKISKVLKENNNIFIITKVLKCITHLNQVIKEFKKTLLNLNYSSVNLLLLY